MSKIDNSSIAVKDVQCILDGISDVIKVFKPDHTVYFCNEAGYNFYKKSPNEVEKKVCYKLLNKDKPCKDCCFAQVVKYKKEIKLERYIPELNKIMNTSYTPVLDENNNIKFIIERLEDITERKTLDKILKNDKERYIHILNNSPDALMIIVDNRIEVANNEAVSLFDQEHEEIINSNIYKYFDERYSKILHKKFRNIILSKKLKEKYDCELNFDNNKKTSVQLTCRYMMYEGKSAILMTVRNTSESRKDLIRAANFQRNSLQRDFQGGKFFENVCVYVPAYTISGDFYRVNKINDELFIGILIDVKGKGISAALNISALELMFMEETFTEYEPINIVKNLNRKIAKYYEENYIAVCCFSINFSKKEFKIVGAGINQFMFQKQGKKAERKLAEGPFLGMFSDSEFSEKKIQIQSGDRLFLFSDGLDFIFDEDEIIKRYMEKVTLNDFKKYIDEYLEDTILDEGKLKDDSTMIGIEIK